MMKNVSIKANPMMIEDGGMVWVPIACLKKEKTTTKRKKLVVMKTIPGANVKIVNTIRTFKLFTSCCGVSGAVSVRFTVGIVGSAPNATTQKRSKTIFFTWVF